MIRRGWVHGLVGLFGAATFLVALASRGQLARVASAADAIRFPIPGWVWPVAAVVVGAGYLGWRATGRRFTEANLSVLGSAVLLALLAAFLHPLGRHAGLVLLALAIGLGLGALAGGPPSARPPDRGPDADRRLGAGLYLATAFPMALFSMHRHWAFGSGSWDLGCEVHNAFRTSRGLSTVSTVLGDVDFIGDHFLVGFYLYAPYFWISSSAYAVLLLQALHLAVTSPAVFGIARLHGASRPAAAALGLATGLSFGLQASAFFDAHEITLGFGFFAGALYAMERRAWWTATGLLVLFSLFKESVGMYVVGLGLWLWVRSLSANSSPVRTAQRRFGTAWVAYGAVCFVVVNRVIMPWFRANGNAPEPHETFADFGPDVFSAGWAMATQPLRTLWVMFVPQPKLDSLVLTMANAAWLPLLSPSVVVAALPLLAERFLSSKPTMWLMGYHYAAPLCLYAGWAGARGLGAVQAWVRAPARYRPDWAVAGFVLAMAVGATAFGSREPSNFYVWRYDYYSSPAKRAANRAAVEFLRREAPDGRLAVQNRILPHLAAREFIYRLGDHEKADWVLVSVGENAWPYPARYPQTLKRKLEVDPNWQSVFEQDDTFVFRRRTASNGPEVSE